MKKLRTILQSRYFFKIIGIIFIIYAIIIINFFESSSVYSEKSNIITGMITKYEIDGNQCTIYLKAKEKILIYYYLQNKEEKEYYEKKLELGNKLEVQGAFSKPSKNTIPNGFNFRQYLQYHQINYIVKATSISIKENNTSILYHIKNLMIKRIDKIDKTGYLRTFLLGDKTVMDKSVLGEYQSNGISHLFSISGMHVTLIVSIILFLLDKFSYNAFYKYSIIIPILLFYLFLTNFSASITRTVIMFILFAINQCLHLKVKAIDIMILTLVVAIIINPYLLLDIGFQFSYIISTSLVLFSKKISQSKNKLIRNFQTSWFCFLVSFPICIYYFYQVNIFSVLLNLIMIPMVSIIVFPLTIITFFLPIIYPIYQVAIEVLESINHFASNISCFEIIFAKPSIWIIYIYYVIIFLSVWKKKFLILLLLIVLLHKYFPNWNQEFLFTTLDVGQGDAIFIKIPNNQGNILIDTGGKIEVEQEKWKQKRSDDSIATKRIIPYLKSLGITRLDYLILTHGDYDHMGEAKNLIKNFSVSNVIFNKGEYNKLETDLIKVLKQKKITSGKSKQNLKIGQYIFQFLNQTIYKGEEENKNSNIIYFKYDQYRFLLLGDAYIDNEKELIKNYRLGNIDFLKVGHHGSNTSSDKTFIDSIQPKISIISVGRNNRYGHPNEEVLNRLKDSKIYRTDQMGSIVVQIKSSMKIMTYAP